jgi:hypothetical protein
MKFGQKQTMRDKAAAVDGRYGKTLGASKGKAPVSAKPKIKASGTNPLKKKIGVKATWKF